MHKKTKWKCSQHAILVMLKSCRINKNGSVKLLQPLVQEMWSSVMWVLCVFGGLVIAELSRFGTQKLLGVSSEKWEFTSDSQCHLQTTANWHCSERIGPLKWKIVFIKPDEKQIELEWLICNFLTEAETTTLVDWLKKFYFLFNLLSIGYV